MSPDPKTDDPALRRTSLVPFPDVVLGMLTCPVCDLPLREDADRLHCSQEHSFDRARHGHVTLRRGGRPSRNADSAAMVAARDYLLGTGLFEPVRQRAGELITAFAPDASEQTIVDLAGGTGYYLAGLLDRMPGSFGICVDLSTHALRRAARSHRSAVAIGADLRERLPIADDSATVITSFFGPRPAAEIRRILRGDGIHLVATPTPMHLVELVTPLGMLTVHARKDERLAQALHPLRLLARDEVGFTTTISRKQAAAIANMGPSAHHTTPEQTEARVRRLSVETSVTVSVNVCVYGWGCSGP